MVEVKPAERQKLLENLRELRWDELAELIYEAVEPRDRTYEDGDSIIEDKERIVVVETKPELEQPKNLLLAIYSWTRDFLKEDYSSENVAVSNEGDDDYGLKYVEIVARPNLEGNMPWEEGYHDSFGQQGHCSQCEIDFISNAKSIKCPVCGFETSAT